MRRYQKKFLWITGGVGAFLVLLLASLLLVPRVINLEPIREKILISVSEKVGAQIEYQRIDLSFFPSPHAVIQHGRISLPGMIAVKLDSLTVYPKILPLFKGRLQIVQLIAEGPEVDVRMFGKPGKEDDGGTGTSSIESLEKEVASILTMITSEEHDTLIRIDNGTVNLKGERDVDFWFKDIQVHITHPKNKLNITISCKSNLWERIHFEGWIDPGEFKGEGNIDLERFEPYLLTSYLLPNARQGIEDAQMRLNIHFKTEGLRLTQAEIQSFIPSLALFQESNKLVVKGISLKGSLNVDEDKTSIFLTGLELDSPKLNISGKFIMDQSSGPNSRPIVAELVGRDVDIDSVRKAALKLAGDVAVVQDIFDIVKGGKMPLIAFQTHGNSIGDLGDLENIIIKGNILDGEISVPEVDLPVEIIKGDIIISKGVLEGKNLEARVDNIQINDGTFRLGLLGDKAPFHLDAGIQVDLAQLLSLSRRFVKNESFQKEINRVKELKGNATGRLVLGESLKSIKAAVEVSKLKLYTRLQGIPLPLNIIRGQVYYGGTKISVKDLEVKVGKSYFSGLSARLDWGRKPYLEVTSKSSKILLGEIYPWLSTFDGVRDALKILQSVKGAVVLKTLSLKGPILRPKDWQIRTTGEAKNLYVKSTLLPVPMEISRGWFSYGGTKISLKNFRGKIGMSSFSGLSTRLNLGRHPNLEGTTGTFRIVLEEIHQWLLSFKGPKDALKTLKSVNGIVALDILNLNGPLLRPLDWRFQLSGELENLIVNSISFPEPLTVATGKFQASPDMISLADSQIDIMDTSFMVSGSMGGYLEGNLGLGLAFQGSMGPQSIHWISDFVQLPSELNIRPPLTISKANLTWNNRGETAFSGSVAFKDGPEIAAHVLLKPDELVIKKLSILDDQSRAFFTLKAKNKEVDLSFKGNLSKNTLDELIKDNRVLTGWIKGDFRTHISMTDPISSTIHGELHGKDLVLPLKLMAPVMINHFSLDFTGSGLNVESADFTWNDSNLQLAGNMNFSANGILLDMAIAADLLDLEKIEKTLEKDDKTESDKQSEKFWPLPMQGVLRIKMDHLKYKDFTSSPFHADISFRDDGADITVTKADICGVSTPGILKISSNDLQLDFKPFSKDKELQATIECLAGDNYHINGKFDFDGEVTAQGMNEALARSFQGNFEFVATDGRIYRLEVLTKIIALLSITEIFVGKLPDLIKEGFAYNSIRIKGNVQNGRLILSDIVVDGSSMNITGQGDVDFFGKKINLTVLVAPFKTVDRIVRLIPLLRYILGGTLISIPIKITGDLGNPLVIPLSPDAIGSGIVEMMKRTVELPVKIIQPILPKEKEKQVAPKD